MSVETKPGERQKLKVEDNAHIVSSSPSNESNVPLRIDESIGLETSELKVPIYRALVGALILRKAGAREILEGINERVLQNKGTVAETRSILPLLHRTGNADQMESRAHSLNTMSLIWENEEARKGEKQYHRFAVKVQDGNRLDFALGSHETEYPADDSIYGVSTGKAYEISFGNDTGEDFITTSMDEQESEELEGEFQKMSGWVANNINNFFERGFMDGSLASRLPYKMKTNITEVFDRKSLSPADIAKLSGELPSVA